MHAQRANFQSTVWRQCLQRYPILPNPTESGWEIDDGTLAIKWIQGPHAPEAVLQLVACKCVHSCKSSDCPCPSNGLKCTDMSKF